MKDDHLVQIQKTYQLGDKFNILFPCAKTNLHEYLRDRKWHAPQYTRISKNPLWEQVLGITKALSKIINFADPEDPSHVIFGWHLDLKPQNILVDNATDGSRDIFKITDFGQTRFEAAFVTRISGGGGTEAYAPPEYLDETQNRTYDVWSLGIIVLEILIYAIRGVDGLLHHDTGLDIVRSSTEDSHENSRFYIGRGSRARIKPKILEWKENLFQDPILQDEENHEFVENLLRIIMLMLEPQMKKRITIDEVVIKMGEVFQMKVFDPVEFTAESLKHKDEVILVDLK